MSFQVGWACYSTLQDAGAAACSTFTPSTITLSSGFVQSISCAGSDKYGGLTIFTSTLNPATGDLINTSRPILIAYANCLYPDFVEAGLTIFSALLALYFVGYGFRKIIELLNWSRGDGL